MGLLLLPVLTRYFAPRDYGIIALISVLSVLTSGIYALGTGNSMGLCYHEAENIAERAKVIWTTSILLLANSLLLTLIGCLLAPQVSTAMLGSADYAYPLCLSLATLAVNTVTMPFLAYLQLEERAKTYVALSLISSLVTLLLTIFLVVYRGRGINGMFEAGLAGAIVLFIIVIVTVLPRLGVGLNFKWVGPLVKIGFPSVFGIGAFFLIDWSDRIMLERFIGLDEVGRYSIGYSFGMVISLAVTAFGSAWPPYFISFLHKREEAAALFGQIFKYYVILFGSLTLLFFLMARPVVTVMTAAPYHSAFTVVGLVAFSYMLKGCYLIMLPALVYEKKLYLQTVIEWAAAAINVGLNFLLIPLFRKQGAAVSTLIAYFCLPLLAYLIGRKYLPVQYDWKSTGKFAVAFVVLAALSFVPFPGTPLFGLALGLFFFVLCGLYVLYVTFSGKEREVIIGFVATLKKRFLYS